MTAVCAVIGCTRPPTVFAPVWIGGLRRLVRMCGPHAAEYRVDEASL